MSLFPAHTPRHKTARPGPPARAFCPPCGGLVLAAVVAVVALPAALLAQPKSGKRSGTAPSASHLAVDVVRLKSGVVLHGAVLAQSLDGVATMAVDRQWLKRTAPRFHDALAADEARLVRLAHQQLLERIPEWKAQRHQAPRLVKLLDDEAARLRRAVLAEQRDPSAGPQTQFTLVELPRAKIERLLVQPPDRRQVALMAWREQLDDVEGRSAESLARELHQRGIDPARHRVDLSSELPARPQSAAEWAARRALVEYSLRRAIDFQGTGEALFQTGDDAERPQPGALVAALLKSQLAAQLQDLLVETAGAQPHSGKDREAIEAVCQKVERQEGTGFRLSRVRWDASGTTVAVESRFYALLPETGWQVVWQTTQTAEAGVQRREAETRIRQDPAVKQALQLLGGAASDQVAQAIAGGAATLEALEECQARFADFQLPLLNRLDVPPIFLLGEAGGTAR